MFKSVVIYRFCKPMALTAREISARLAENAFRPPEPSQVRSAGFVPPMGPDAENLNYVHQADGRWLICLQVAVRKVKPAELNKRLQERVAAIEEGQHRRVFRKERQALKEEILLELLPNAFPEERRTRAYITPRQGLLVVEAGSHNAAEDFLTALRHALGGLPVALPQVFSDPGVTMLAWLRGDEMVDGLSIGLFAEFKGDDGGRVTLTNENPLDERASGYLEGGYKVSALALATDADMAGIEFRLTSDLLIKSIKSDYEVEIGEGIADADDNPLAFQTALLDAELTLFAGVLDEVWRDLIAAFGGYSQGMEPATWQILDAGLGGEEVVNADV